MEGETLLQSLLQMFYVIMVPLVSDPSVSYSSFISYSPQSLTNSSWTVSVVLGMQSPNAPSNLLVLFLGGFASLEGWCG